MLRLVLIGCVLSLSCALGQQPVPVLAADLDLAASMTTAASAPPAAYSSSKDHPDVVMSVEPMVTPAPTLKGKGFQWRSAFLQSFTLICMQNAGNLAMDYWMRWELRQGHFWRNYGRSVKNFRWTVWNDNDPFLDDYIAHPLQGSLNAFIQIQNDPQYRALELSKSKAYWKSRARALAWAALWSTEWKIGPLSEAAIGNTGLGTYYSHESHGITNGTGMVDMIMTPVGGVAWSIGEDVIYKLVVSRLKPHSRHFFWKGLRAFLTPTHSGANVLRLKKPWYRDSEAERATRLASSTP